MTKKPYDPQAKVREMTNQQIRALRKAGLHPHCMELAEVGKHLDEFTDWVLDTLYAECDFSNVPQRTCVELAGKVLRATYGQEEETKNS